MQVPLEEFLQETGRYLRKKADELDQQTTLAPGRRRKKSHNIHREFIADAAEEIERLSQLAANDNTILHRKVKLHGLGRFKIEEIP